MPVLYPYDISSSSKEPGLHIPLAASRPTQGRQHLRNFESNISLSEFYLTSLKANKIVQIEMQMVLKRIITGYLQIRQNILARKDRYSSAIIVLLDLFFFGGALQPMRDICNRIKMITSEHSDFISFLRGAEMYLYIFKEHVHTPKSERDMKDCCLGKSYLVRDAYKTIDELLAPFRKISGTVLVSTLKKSLSPFNHVNIAEITGYVSSDYRPYTQVQYTQDSG